METTFCFLGAASNNVRCYRVTKTPCYHSGITACICMYPRVDSISATFSMVHQFGFDAICMNWQPHTFWSQARWGFFNGARGKKQEEISTVSATAQRTRTRTHLLPRCQDGTLSCLARPRRPWEHMVSSYKVADEICLQCASISRVILSEIPLFRIASQTLSYFTTQQIMQRKLLPEIDIGR